MLKDRKTIQHCIHTNRNIKKLTKRCNKSIMPIRENWEINRINTLKFDW